MDTPVRQLSLGQRMRGEVTEDVVTRLYRRAAVRTESRPRPPRIVHIGRSSLGLGLPTVGGRPHRRLVGSPGALH